MLQLAFQLFSRDRPIYRYQPQ